MAFSISAKLKYSPLRSQWVSCEIWRPAQRSTTESDGRFVLSIPYSDDRQLVGEILRFGPDVEVLGPHELTFMSRERLTLPLKTVDVSSPQNLGKERMDAG